MVKTLLQSIREYKKASILTPIYVALEVLLECILPFVMADLIDHMDGTSMDPVHFAPPSGHRCVCQRTLGGVSGQ